MKITKRALAAGLVCAAALALAPMAYAANSYTVTVRTGSYGTFADGTREKTLSVVNGEVNLGSLGSIVLKDSVHVATSLYCAPQAALGEPDATVAPSAQLAGVNEDRVYVAVYDAAVYTVGYQLWYVDADSGTQLAAPYFGHGKDGQKVTATPVAIAGYTAVGGAQSVTLKDGSVNAITFSYKKN